MSQQLVAFTTSSEYEEFVPVLHKAAREDVQYLTMFRLNNATRPLLADVDDSKKALTLNGALVTSKTFFETFDTKAYDESETEGVA